MVFEWDEDDLVGTQEFEAAEHEAIGNAIKLITDRDQEPVSSFRNPLKTVVKGSTKVPLFFGRIIALAGDFYTTHDEDVTPISGGPGTPLPEKPYNQFSIKDDKAYECQKKRFLSAADSLSNDTDGYLFKLSNVLNKEDSAVNEVRHAAPPEGEKEKPVENTAQAYHRKDHGIPGDLDFAKATTAAPTWNPLDVSLAYYAHIAWTNFDHFNVDAVTAYGVGHSVALEKAAAAGRVQDASERKEALNDAYFHEAFAAHYLTDMFSSGHIRSPRRKLHNPSYIDAGLDKLKGKSVNDDQCRCMHDDDSAAGVLVSNALGQEWIAYGDKQYFSPQNSLNRLYSIEALQLGVQEVIDAFTSRNTPLPLPQDYKALKKTPAPQLAYSSIMNSLPVYDSTAPLWKWNDDGSHIYTTRTNIEDLSDFSSRSPADPSVFSGICEAIKNSPYFGDDQFPNTLPLTVLTGGFVHIQELPNGDITNPSGSKFSLNSWGTVDIPDVTKEGARKLTFTLRNRSRSFEIIHQLPLCWKKWSQGSKTSLIRFDFDQGTNTVKCSSFLMDTKQPNQTSQVVKVQDMDNYPIKVSGTQFQSQSVAAGPFSLAGTNLLRFFILPFLSSSSSQNPNILALGWTKSANNYQATLSITSTTNEFYNPKIKIQYVDPLTRPAADIAGQLKLYKGEQDMVPRVIHLGSKSTVSLVTREWSIVNDTSITGSNPASGSVSVQGVTQTLVGDILGRKYEQILALSGTWPSCNVTILASSATGQPWTELSSTQDSIMDKKYALQNTAGITVNQHYVTALISRYSESGDDREPALKAGLDALQVSSIHKDGKNYLNFRTIVGTAGGALGSIRDSVTAAGSPAVLDEFYGNPHYFSIAWLRASQEIPDQDLISHNAVLHVFSYYGVLGVRVYAPMKYSQATGKNDSFYRNYGPYYYKLVGQSAFMGTPSLGMGMGSEGVWGYGVLPWGQFDEWVDVNIWNPVTKSWIMTAADGNRSNIRGWDVKARPAVH